MLIIGAKGHAKEVLGVIEQCGESCEIVFFDDVSTDLPDRLFGRYPILRNIHQAQDALSKDNRFVLGVGDPFIRYSLAQKFLALNGEMVSIISPYSRVGNHNVLLGRGLNVMTGAIITNDVAIGEGTLINAGCSIHHDTRIGIYCEISHGVRVTGRCAMGDFCSIGTGAVLIPKVRLGNNVVVAAGAVVTRDVGNDIQVVGIPARPVKKRQNLIERLSNL